MAKKKIADLIERDHWAIVEGKSNDAFFLLRFRRSVFRPLDITGYDNAVRVLWAYDSEDSGTMPTLENSDEMGLFEDRLIEAVETDGQSVLTAVLTFDGARQWVFYTGNVHEFGKRLSNMPQNDEPYPIEIIANRDPTWKFLQDEILWIVPEHERNTQD